MYGLNIHLISFRLFSKDVHPKDKIRVSITSIPEENKQAFFIEANKINDIHHFFTINITKQTKKLLFVFRKKSIFQGDPIIVQQLFLAINFQQKKMTQQMLN